MNEKNHSPEQLHVQFNNKKNNAWNKSLEQAGNKYQEYGCFLAKGLFNPSDFESIFNDIKALIEIRSRLKNISNHCESDGLFRFDDGFLELAKNNRQDGSVIFDACRRLLPLHLLSVDQRLIAIAKYLMKNNLLIASDVKAIRIDYPDESKYLFDWHQDYPYIMDSEDAVVFWIPLHDVDDVNGTIKVAVGSFSLGLMNLRIIDNGNKQNNKQQFMEIVKKEEVNNFPQFSIPASLGDVLVFNTMTLHKSQPNISSRARWTAQIRFGNFEHQKSVERDWPGSLRDGSWFEDKHPEYVNNLEDIKIN